MLEYEWGNPATTMLPGEEPTSDSDQIRQIFDQYHQTLAGNNIRPEMGFSSEHQTFQNQNQNHPLQALIDARSYSRSIPRHPVTPSPVGLPQPFPIVGGKNDDIACGEFPPSRLGLNLGGRTYFSSSEDDFVSRLYRRARSTETGPANSPKCQAEGCAADLTHAKYYHRRHKVCEFHSKASTVLAAGLTQRFCQQCSRFHLLSEFDQGKRSCRKRLADHNRRRRKSQPPQQKQPQTDNSPVTVETTSKSSPESGTRSSSVSIAISPPRIALDCFRPRNPASASTSASASCFDTLLSPPSIFRRFNRRIWDEEQ